MKKIFFLVFLTVSLFSKEISVFGAGDIDSSSPYGLTKAEKAVLKNSKKLKTLNKKLNRVELNYEDLSQKIDGIESVYESDSKSLNKTKKSLTYITNAIDINSKNIKKNSSFETLILDNSNKLKELELKLDQFIELQEKNNKIVEESLENTTILINTINDSYVSRKQFDELVEYINKNSSTKKKRYKKEIKRSNKDELAYAISLFNKNYITKSKPIFLKLIKKKYKPALSNFYLAEVYYRKRKYSDAIHYYKVSMMLYDQAKYIPRLLLHSAISFEKIKDLDNAINFYSTLIDAYPQTKEAKQAQKKLDKLQ